MICSFYGLHLTGQHAATPINHSGHHGAVWYIRQGIVFLYIRNQTLYVHLTSAALRQELMMGRELLVRTLNQRVGATVITNIIFR